MGAELGHTFSVEGTETVGTWEDEGLAHWGGWCGALGLGSSAPPAGDALQGPRGEGPCHQGCNSWTATLTEAQKVLGSDGPEVRTQDLPPCGESQTSLSAASTRPDHMALVPESERARVSPGMSSTPY